MAEQKVKKPSRSGPSPAHTLLDAIRASLAAGVQAAQIVPILDMARNANGVMQAPVWRSCAQALDEYTEQSQGQRDQPPGSPAADAIA
jgi:hypothetical protein